MWLQAAAGMMVRSKNQASMTRLVMECPVSPSTAWKYYLQQMGSYLSENLYHFS